MIQEQIQEKAISYWKKNAPTTGHPNAVIDAYIAGYQQALLDQQQQQVQRDCDIQEMIMNHHVYWTQDGVIRDHLEYVQEEDIDHRVPGASC